MLRTIGAIALATTTAGATLLATVLPAHAVPTHEIRVASLPAGDPAEVPIIVAGRIVDGDRTVSVSGYRFPTLIGTSDDSYVVLGVIPGENRHSVAVIAADGTSTRIAKGIDRAELSDDGTRLATSRHDRRITRIRVHDTATGDVIAARSAARWTDVFDVDATRVVTGGWSTATRLWAYSRDRTRRLSRHAGQFADLSSGVFATYTGDPYDGGCTEMARLGAPRQKIWRNCAERLWAISPGGTRMATIGIIADGPGPGQITLRRTAGRRLAEFEISGYFGAVTFEDDRDLLFEAIGRRREAWVRGNGRVVERVTRLRPARVV